MDEDLESVALIDNSPISYQFHQGPYPSLPLSLPPSLTKSTENVDLTRKCAALELNSERDPDRRLVLRPDRPGAAGLAARAGQFAIHGGCEACAWTAGVLRDRWVGDCDGFFYGFS